MISKSYALRESSIDLPDAFGFAYFLHTSGVGGYGAQSISNASRKCENYCKMSFSVKAVNNTTIFVYSAAQ